MAAKRRSKPLALTEGSDDTLLITGIVNGCGNG